MSHPNIRAMGFLSRKKKNPEPVVTEDTHPLEEELARMEEAVPERPVDEYEPEYDDAPDVRGRI